MDNKEYYIDLKEYTNKLIDRAITGEVDLSLLKKVLVRQGNINSDECFMFYFPFVFTKTLGHTETKNTKDFVCKIGLPRLNSFEKEQTEQGLNLILVNISSSMDNFELEITDMLMLAFAYFYRETDDKEDALQKTKDLFEKMKTFDYYDDKEDFVERLREY